MNTVPAFSDLNLSPVLEPGEPAANHAPGPIRTTLWDLVSALQEAADEVCETEAEADHMVALAMLDIHEVTCPEQVAAEPTTEKAA